MKMLGELRNKANMMTLFATFILLAVTVTLGIEVLLLSNEVSSIKQAITCGQVFHDGATGQDRCIGLQDQLNEIQDRIN